MGLREELIERTLQRNAKSMPDLRGKAVAQLTYGRISSGAPRRRRNAQDSNCFSNSSSLFEPTSNANGERRLERESSTHSLGSPPSRGHQIADASCRMGLYVEGAPVSNSRGRLSVDIMQDTSLRVAHDGGECSIFEVRDHRGSEPEDELREARRLLRDARPDSAPGSLDLATTTTSAEPLPARPASAASILFGRTPGIVSGDSTPSRPSSRLSNPFRSTMPLLHLVSDAHESEKTYRPAGRRSSVGKRKTRRSSISSVLQSAIARVQ